MTKIDKQKVLEDYSWAMARLTSKLIPIIKASYKDINLLDLLMNLPVKFEVDEINPNDLPLKKDGSQVKPEDVSIGGYITRDSEAGNPDRLVVFLTFTKSTEQNWDQYFNKLLSDNAFQHSIAFVYMHEAMHLLLRHYDFYLNNMYSDIVKRIRPEMDEKSTDTLLNHAFDYYINGYLIEQAEPHTTIASYKEEANDFTGLYDSNLSPHILQQQEIVEKLAKEAEFKKQSITNSDGDTIGEITEITINGNTDTSITINSGACKITQQPRPSEAEQEISEVLSSARENLLEKTRGEGSTGTLQKLGVDYSVPVDWFKLLKNSLFTMVRHHTSQYDQTWGKIKNKFRHIAMMPGKIYYEKELAVIVSIDQSGSMSNDDLEKINYVVTELAKKAIFVEVMLHDHRVAEQKKFIGKQFRGIREFVTNRVACGGTSHQEVFQRIDSIRRDNPKVKLIYLSFSDNYSDIEQCYNTELFKKITPYWITTDERNPVKVPGMQISLEHGLLQT